MNVKSSLGVYKKERQLSRLANSRKLYIPPVFTKCSAYHVMITI